MKGDPPHPQPNPFARLKYLGVERGRRAEFWDGAQGVGFLDFDTEDGLSTWIVLFHFDCFFWAIERHKVNSILLCLLDVVRLLHRIGIYDAIRRRAKTQYFLNLTRGRTIEAVALFNHFFENNPILIRFHGVKHFDVGE